MSEEQKHTVKKTDDVNRSARSVLQGGTPDLGVKLSRMYEFTVDGKHAPQLVKEAAISGASYIKPIHATNSDLTIPMRLTESGRIKLSLPPGVTMVMGRSGSGKTNLTLARMNALNDNTFYVRFGEPLDRHFALSMASDPDRELGLFLHQHEAQLADSIARFLFTDDLDVMIIDSLRYLVYAGGGATGKGGVNMSLFADISFLDVVASLRGKSIVVVVNPLTNDDDAYKSLIEAARGSVAALIDVESVHKIKYTSRFRADRDFTSIQLPELTDATIDIPGGQKLSVKTATTLDLRNALK